MVYEYTQLKEWIIVITFDVLYAPSQTHPSLSLFLCNTKFSGVFCILLFYEFTI